MLANYSNLRDPDHANIELLCWSLFSAGIVTEQQFAALYDIFHSPTFPSLAWFIEDEKNIHSLLKNMLRSVNSNVARLAAASLSTSSWRSYSVFSKKQFKETWIGDKFWQLAKNKDDIWAPRYIKGMARCKLRWSDSYEEWFEDIKKTDIDQVVQAWAQVITEAGYSRTKDRDKLFELVRRILKGGRTFPDAIHSAALARLGQIVVEKDYSGIDEDALNLPLSRN